MQLYLYSMYNLGITVHKLNTTQIILQTGLEKVENEVPTIISIVV